MAKKNVAPKHPVGQRIPLSRIAITWTPPKDAVAFADPKPITISGERIAWLLRTRGAQKPSPASTPKDELEMVELQLRGLSELLNALSEGLPSGTDEGAIFWFLHEAADSMIRDLQHTSPYTVERLMESATVVIADEPKAEVA